MKRFITATVFLFAAALLFSVCAATTADNDTLSKEVWAVVKKRLAVVNGLAESDIVINGVRESNLLNRDLTLSEIKKRDDEWKNADGVNEFIKPFITNRVAQYLIDFQYIHDGFPEIFIADARGLIVAETNKTSDYYQADEDWWVTAYNGGEGKVHFGDIEYDESALSESIAIYVPVIDPETGKAIGVIKALCDIIDIKMEL